MEKDLSQYFLMLNMALMVIATFTIKAPIKLMFNKEVAVTENLVMGSIIFVASIFSLIIVFYLAKVTKQAENKSS